MKIVTLNLAGERSVIRIIKDLTTAGLSEADLWLLQEMERVSDGEPRLATELREHFGPHFAYAAEHALKVGTATGLGLVSCYELRDVRRVRLPYNDRLFNPRERIALMATAMTPLGGLRIANVHLDTRISVDQRLRQLRPVLDRLTLHRGPQLIGGDFNTADVGWIQHLLPIPNMEHHAVAVHDELRRWGFQSALMPFTRTSRHWPYSLDGLFIKGLSHKSSATHRVSFSDHYALSMEVLRRQ